MYHESHPANLKWNCERCGELYFIADGCECYNLSDEELEQRNETLLEIAIENYEYNEETL